MSRNADVAVGMMDNAYFVGRGELLDFFNSLLDLQLTKIEQTASGAVACQLTEYIFPGSIPMSRVNWEARSDYEFVANYKLLQGAFNKNKIQRHVDVDKLIRAKYQDNLEFCQWLKAFFDQAGAMRENYDPAAVRARGKGGKKYNEFLTRTASKHGSKPLPAARNKTTRPAPIPSPRNKPRPAPTTTRVAARPAPVKTTTARTTKAPVKPKIPLRSTENKNIPSNAAKAQKAQADAELMKKNAEMSQKLEEIETSMAEIEKERDFYFGKLRNVELMLQVNQDNNFEGTDLETVVGSIFKVLYATAEEDVIVSDVGEIVPASQEFSELETSQLEAEVVDDSAFLEKTGVDMPEIDATNISNIAPAEGEVEDLLADEPDEF